jgi:hypothetical protein
MVRREGERILSHHLPKLKGRGSEERLQAHVMFLKLSMSRKKD